MNRPRREENGAEDPGGYRSGLAASLNLWPVKKLSEGKVIEKKHHSLSAVTGKVACESLPNPRLFQLMHSGANKRPKVLCSVHWFHLLYIVVLNICALWGLVTNVYLWPIFTDCIFYPYSISLPISFCFLVESWIRKWTVSARKTCINLCFYVLWGQGNKL